MSLILENMLLGSDWLTALQSVLNSERFFELTSRLNRDIAGGVTVYPPVPLIFNAYNAVKPQEVKVVILGQDPYHNEGEAMGLSFSVPLGVKIPASLRNIYKELVADVGFVMPPHGDLTSWTHQGVFLLNSILTVEKNKPASHKNLGWQHLTDETISHLSSHYSGLIFMLWGNFAKSKTELIDTQRHLILDAAHPSPLARNAFSGCRHFSKANQYLTAIGKNPIDWQI
jgi:uracil-DNA glycosylase